MRSRALLVGIILLVVVLATIVVVLGRTDFDRYRPEIAKLLSGALGREVQIHGPLALQLGVVPRIRVEEVTLANAPGQSPAEMAKIGRLWLELDLWQLLAGQIELRDLRLRDAEVLLEWSPQGVPNWPSFGSATLQKPESGGRGFELRKLEIENLSLRLHDAASGSRREARFDRVSLARWRDAQRIEISGAGEIAGVPFDLSGTTGTVADLVSGESSFPIDLEGQLFELDVEISGAAGGGEERGHLDLRISASTPESAPITRRLGLQLAARRPLRGSAKVALRKEVIRLSELSLEVGSDPERGTKLIGELEGTFPSGARPQLTARLESPEIHLADLELASSEEEDDDGIAQPAATQLENEPLPFQRLRGLDADLSIHADRVVGRGELLVEQVHLPIQLVDGVLALGPLALQFEGGSFTGSAAIDASSDPPNLALAFRGTGMQLGRALAQVQEHPAATGIADLTLQLQSRGASLEELRAGLEGDASLVIRDGELYVKRMGMVAQDVFRSLFRGTRDGVARTARRIVGKAKDGAEHRANGDTKPIQCFAAHFEIERGIATAQVLALDTGEALMLGTGQIDLVQQAIDIHIQPKVTQRSVLAVAVPLDIKGPLRAPEVSPRVLEAAGTTATGVVGKLTAPAAKALSLFNGGTSDEKSCADLRAALSP